MSSSDTVLAVRRSETSRFTSGTGGLCRFSAIACSRVPASRRPQPSRQPMRGACSENVRDRTRHDPKAKGGLNIETDAASAVRAWNSPKNSGLITSQVIDLSQLFNQPRRTRARAYVRQSIDIEERSRVYRRFQQTQSAQFCLARSDNPSISAAFARGLPHLTPGPNFAAVRVAAHTGRSADPAGDGRPPYGDGGALGGRLMACSPLACCAAGRGQPLCACTGSLATLAAMPPWARRRNHPADQQDECSQDGRDD
jgi:hypothetical protein